MATASMVSDKQKRLKDAQPISKYSNGLVNLKKFWLCFATIQFLHKIIAQQFHFQHKNKEFRFVECKLLSIACHRKTLNTQLHKQTCIEIGQ